MKVYFAGSIRGGAAGRRALPQGYSGLKGETPGAY